MVRIGLKSLEITAWPLLVNEPTLVILPVLAIPCVNSCPLIVTLLANCALPVTERPPLSEASPVTPRVPPIVSLFVTASELSVAAPVV